ncbi:hypothetical protein CK220_23995 [Mesorhizobium sp. WSM3860]|nr:hypothetical protein CK220_23995 [Mesorhizobium sp. WSM3860]
MPHFFFDVSDTGDVYPDARGVLLPGSESAKERALEIARKMVAGRPLTQYRGPVCTVRDPNGTQLMQIRIELGTRYGPRPQR